MSGVLRVLLADDEPLALERLIFAFRDIAGTQIVGTAENGLEAATKIAELRPDVAVLDIQMPGRTGVGIVAELHPSARPDVIFVTAYDQHAVDAFDLEATDYLLKPLRLDRLRQAIDRVRRRRSGHAQPAALADAAKSTINNERCFWVQEGGRLVRVGVEEIDWIEAAKDYVLLHTGTRSHILRATMNAIEAQFAPSELRRVHRSAFVRPEAVQSFHCSAAGGGTLVLKHDVAVRVGATYLPDVLRCFRSNQSIE